jgi:hypothetical protein
LVIVEKFTDDFGQVRVSLQGMSLVLFPYFCGEAATVEVNFYGVAYGYLSGVAEDLAGGVGGYGVAAF